MPTGGSRSIAAHCLSAQKLKKEADGLTLVIEGMLDHATARSNASPAADEAGLAKQRFLDRQRIEPGHVLARVMPFDIEPIVLRDHDEQNRAVRILGPMTGLNHWTRIDSFR